MIFSYNSNKLLVNGNMIELMEVPAKIYKIVMPKDNIIIAMLDVYHISKEEKSFDRTRNIFAINEKGEVVWQIEKAPFPGKIKRSEPFVNVWINKEGILRVNTGDGMRYDVDILTGKLSNPEFTK